MKIAIVDDIVEDRQEAISYITSYCNTYHPDLPIEYVEFNSGEKLLITFRPGLYDIILLDVYMDGKNGIDTAKEIYQKDQTACLMFFSDSDFYVLESFSVQPVYYILKPLSMHRIQLEEGLQLCFDKLEKLNEKPKSLEVTINKFKAQLPLKNIIYVDCQLRRCRIHMVNNDIIIVANPVSYCINQLLKEEIFMECYREVAVNMDYIKNIYNNYILLTNGEQLPIARRKKREFLNLYVKHLVNKAGGQVLSL